jgi:hypothetical protein
MGNSMPRAPRVTGTSFMSRDHIPPSGRIAKAILTAAMSSGSRWTGPMAVPPLTAPGDRSDKHAYILPVPADGLFAGSAPDSRPFTLEVDKGRGIRDLLAVPEGVLLLIGPMTSQRTRAGARRCGTVQVQRMTPAQGFWSTWRWARRPLASRGDRASGPRSNPKPSPCSRMAPASGGSSSSRTGCATAALRRIAYPNSVCGQCGFYADPAKYRRRAMRALLSDGSK